MTPKKLFDTTSRACHSLSGCNILSLLAVFYALTITALGALISFYHMFSQFMIYDDEGQLMLFVRQLLVGDKLYEQIRCPYGPLYFLQRWLVFSVLAVPLQNDTVRVLAVLTWLCTAFFMSATAWLVSSKNLFSLGLAAIAWILSVNRLFAIANEPGHPMELIALVVSLGLFLSALKSLKTPRLFALLGALCGVVISIKINIGILLITTLLLTMFSLYKPRAGWRRLLSITFAFGTAIVPIALIKSGVT